MTNKTYSKPVTRRPYGKTDHEVAVRYAQARWSGKGSRESYMSSVRENVKAMAAKKTTNGSIDTSSRK